MKINQKMRKPGRIGMALILLLAMVAWQLFAAGIGRVQSAGEYLANPEAKVATVDAFLSLPSVNGIVGQTLSIAVTIDTDAATHGAQMGVTFDPTILKCTSVDIGTYYSTWASANSASTLNYPSATCNNTTGTISTFGIALMGAAVGSGPSGNGVLATLHFTLLANGTSALAITNGKVVDATANSLALSLATTDGSVTVGPTATVPSLTATSFHSVTPQPTLKPSSTPTIFVPDCSAADVNQDGVVNIGDVALIGVHYGEKGTAGWILEDVNQDGVIDIGDAEMVGACYGPSSAGSTRTPTSTTTASSTLPTDTSTASRTPVTGTASLTDTQTAVPTDSQTITPSSTQPSASATLTSTGSAAIPTATFTPTSSTTLSTNTPSLTPTTSGTVQITSTSFPTQTPTATSTPAGSLSAIGPTTSVAVGNNFDVPIEINIGQSTRASQFGLSFNPAVIQCNSGDTGPFYNDWANSNGDSVIVIPSYNCDNTNGKLSVVGISLLGTTAGGPSGSGTIATLHFTAKAAGTSALALSDVEIDDTAAKPQTLPIQSINGQVRVGSSLGTASATTTRTSSASITATPTRTLTPTITSTPTQTRTVTNTTASNSGAATSTKTSLPVTALPTIASSSRMGFSPAQSMVTAGDTFTVNLVIDTDTKSRSAQAAISFDPSILTCTSVTQGTFYSAWASANGASTLLYPSPSIDNTAGTVSLTGIAIMGAASSGNGQPAGGPNGTGSFLVLTFTAKANGVSPLKLTNTKIYNNIPIGSGTSFSLLQTSFENGEVFVGVTPTPTPLGGPTALPTLPNGNTPQAAGTDSILPTGTLITPASRTTTGTPASQTPTPAGGSSLNSQGTPQPGQVSTQSSSSYNAILSSKLDSNGIFSQEVLIEDPNEPIQVKFPVNVQALTADKRPLLQFLIQHLVQSPALANGFRLMSAAYDLTPNGATFNPSIQIIFKYDRTKLPKGVSENDLSIATYDTGTSKWILLKSVVDTKNQLVTANITHFSIYALVVPPHASTWIWIVVLSLIGLLIVGTAVFFFLNYYRKNKNLPAAWGLFAADVKATALAFVLRIRTLFQKILVKIHTITLRRK